MRANLGLLTVLTALAVTFLVIPTALAATVPAPTSGVAARTGSADSGFLPAVLYKSNSTGLGGYEAGQTVNSSITFFNASWIQPKVNCTATNSTALFDAILVNNKTAELGGTGVQCRGGVASSFGWYDLSASNHTNITRISAATLPVAAGSHVRISLHAGASVLLKITIGTHTFSKSLATASRDYIGEVGVLALPIKTGFQPLANFGSVAFGQTYTKTTGTNDMKVGTTTKAMGLFPLVGEITMRDKANKVLATPTALVGNGTSFKILWKAST
jgi:hypothetical protein